MVKYNVAFYCPDRHLVYNLHTLNRTGVGGGITARIRTAHALAREGHRVTLYINCPREETIEGVKYKHFSQINNIATDILIVASTGGNLDLLDIENVSISSKINILMLSGINFPPNVPPEDFDFVYIPSNFIRKIAKEQWKTQPQKIFTSHYGVTDKFFRNKGKRDLKSIAYLSHPSKGLESALEIVKILRRKDPDYTLHVFGGNQLWGEQEGEIPPEPGIVYHGLIGQKQLARSIQKMGFSLNLQSREEPFGMVVTESMAAGCVVLASSVGAYPELIRNGFNGFLIPGNHSHSETHEFAANLILQLQENAEYMNYIRQNAINTPFSWQTIAQTWEGHWNSFLKHDKQQNKTQALTCGCSNCSGRMLMLADGLHCKDCGNYQRSIN